MKDLPNMIASVVGGAAVSSGEALWLLANVYVWDAFPDMADGSLPAPPLAPSGFSGPHFRAAIADGLYAARFCDDELGVNEYVLYRGGTVLARVTVRLD